MSVAGDHALAESCNGEPGQPLAMQARTGVARERVFRTWIRSDEHLQSPIAYVEDNTIRKGLAACAEEWPWSRLARTKDGLQLYSTGDKIAGATTA